VRTMLASHETDTCYPFIDKPRVLAGAEMPIMINPAGKDIIVHRTAAPIQPSQQARPSVRQQFELNGPSRLLLHHDCPRSDLSAADNVADLHLHQIAAPQLAIDRQIEKRQISWAAALIEVKTDFPDLLWLQSPLCTRDLPGIPDWALGRGEFGFRYLDGRSPMATLATCRTLASKVTDERFWVLWRPRLRLSRRPTRTSKSDRSCHLHIMKP